MTRIASISTTETAKSNIQYMVGERADGTDVKIPPSVLFARGALVKKSANQTALNATTAVDLAWDSEGADCYDTDSIHDTVTNPSRLTIPSGYTKARISAHVQTQNGTSLSYLIAQIWKNGSNSFVGFASTVADTSTTAPSAYVSTPIITVAAGDYFTCHVQSESDTSIDILSAFSWFAIELIL